MVILEKALPACGYDGDVGEFKDVVNELFVVMFPMWTDEELLVHPNEGLAYCRAVRRRLGLEEEFPSHLILRTLVNTRKARTRGETGVA